MVIVATDEWAGLGLALLMMRQGVKVVVAWDHSALSPKGEAEAYLCGEGLVDKVPLDKAMTKFVGHGHLWVFDSNGLADHADQLRARGESVIGASTLSQRLEDDRAYAMEFAGRAGLKIPAAEKFTDYERAIKWLRKNDGMAFVFKPDKEDPTATYVPLDADQGNEELQEYLAGLAAHKKEGQPSFVLQQMVVGTEANFDVWVRNGKPIAAFCDLEAKRKYNDDLGENLGCAGGYAWPIEMNTPGLKATALKYLDLPEVGDYTGSVDANVIFTDDGVPWFLENCWRLGYNAFPALAYGIARWPIEDILRSWASGGENLAGAFDDDYAASLTLVVDHPKQGTPIMARPSIADHLCLYRAFKEGPLPSIVKGWEEVACVVSSGESIQAAGESCLAIAEKVSIPGVGYRTDLTRSGGKSLPVSRYYWLLEHGLIFGEGSHEFHDSPQKEYGRAGEGHMRPTFRV